MIGIVRSDSSGATDARVRATTYPADSQETAMIRPEDIETLSQRIGEMLPSGMKEGGEGFRRNLRAAVSAQLGRLDLVTREEFDVQRAVLQRSREKLERLQAQVDALEAELARRKAGG